MRYNITYPNEVTYSCQMIECLGQRKDIQKNDRIYTPTEYENLKAEASENFEIRRPKTEDIVDVKKWCPNHYKKLVLSVDSYGRGILKDQKVIFGISKVSHFTFSKTRPGLVTTRESIVSLVSYDFQLLQRMVTRPPLPSILLHMLAKCQSMKKKCQI